MAVHYHDGLAELFDDPGKLTPHPDNPRNGDTDAIIESIRVNGCYRPIYAQRSTGRILAGNHTYAALLELGSEQVPVLWLDVDDQQARKILLADNRTADLGGYDEGLLLELLQGMDDDLTGTGYDDAAMDELAAQVAARDAEELDDEDRAPSTGELLALADVSWGEPDTATHHGQVWRLGPHTLVVAHLQREHHLWAPHLTDDCWFAPYPEPYLTTTTAAEQPLLLVQPNPYLAGHLIDKHRSTHPEDTIELVEDQ